jgi:hypothetical protein
MNEPEMSEVEARIDWLMTKWEWVIGGVVDENPQYVRAIIYDFLGVPIPESTYHTRDGMTTAWAERKRAALDKEVEAELRAEGFYDN